MIQVQEEEEEEKNDYKHHIQLVARQLMWTSCICKSAGIYNEYIWGVQRLRLILGFNIWCKQT